MPLPHNTCVRHNALNSLDGYPVLLLSPGELLCCRAFVSLHADDKRWTFFNNNTLESWLFQPPLEKQIVLNYREVWKIFKKWGLKESTVFKLTMRLGMLWRNDTFFKWRCKCLAILDAIFKVLYLLLSVFFKIALIHVLLFST